MDEAERSLKAYSPITYDVQPHLKAIEAFEIKAVAKAEETVKKIDEELAELQATLKNIEDARPFDQITVGSCVATVPGQSHMCSFSQVDEIGDAHPHLVQTVETMVKKGKWTVPGQCRPLFLFCTCLIHSSGYKEKFGDLSLA